MSADQHAQEHRHHDGVPGAGDWDERYRAAGGGGRVWSGRPNPTLVDEASDLPARKALDVGCGEGADAIWLASRGWAVVAVDFSIAALERGAEHARSVGEDVADRVDWRCRDLRTWSPVEDAFGLVTAHFVHAPSPGREAMLERWAAAVAPGGTLLVVAHSPLDLQQPAVRRPPDPALYATAAQSAALLGSAWHLVAQERPRAVQADGRDVTVHDSVLVARRSSR